jgi:hypothetical protein
MEHKDIQTLFSKLLNSPATLGMCGFVDGKCVIEKFTVRVPNGNFFIHPIYVTMYTNIHNLNESSDILLKWEVDGQYWEDSILPEMLRKYFNIEGTYLVYLKVYSMVGQTLHPESWAENSLYNSF